MAPHEPPVRAGRPKSEQKAEAILGAAGERFPASGFQGTSMDEVAQRAGVSKQTVYSHFASKEALFQACIRAKVAGYGFDETTEVDETDLRAALSTLTRRFVDLLFDPEVIAMHRLVMGESASQPRIAELFFDSGPRRTQDTVTAFLQAQAAKGRLQIDQGRLHYAAMQLLNTAVGMYQLQLWLGLRASVAQDELETHRRRVTGATQRAEADRPPPDRRPLGRRVLPLLLCLLMPGYAALAASPNGAEIAHEVDFVNRFGALANVSYGAGGQPVVLVDLAASGRLVANTFQRWRRNDYPEGAIAARDLVIFRSGKLRGTGILVTDFSDPTRDRAYAVWLPSLRKIRRFAEPDPADGWGNSNFSFGDIYIRRARDERHELLGRETFAGCLGVLALREEQRGRLTQWMPEADCSVQGRPVYRLRSRPLDADPGYDERIVWVDQETFADYRAVYYRDGEVQKVIDKSWRGMKLADPRAQYWRYWYAHTPATGQQGLAFVAPRGVSWNDDLEPDLWSERTLRRTRR